MTRDNAKNFVRNHLITSLGELPHGYVCYQSTANLMIDLLSDEIEILQAENEKLKGIIKNTTKEENDL